jgi:hypothetical protein
VLSPSFLLPFPHGRDIKGLFIGKTNGLRVLDLDKSRPLMHGTIVTIGSSSSSSLPKLQAGKLVCSYVFLYLQGFLAGLAMVFSVANKQEMG